MKVVFADQQLAHAPQHFLSSGAAAANPERPERARVLLGAALESGLVRQEPADLGDDAILSVHAPRYVEFLKHIYQRWSRIADASPEVLPNVHPIERTDGYPRSAVGQTGYHVYDGSCPISADTWTSARWSAMTALEAAANVLAGDDACYALARPPGHHASQDLAGGFCYLNNAALAAARLRSRYPRVAIIDVDVHHGNGTQRVFYDRADVLTVSLHADPIRFYPFFWGYATETGRGEGAGFNLNRPLPRGTRDADYLSALGAVLDEVRAFDPGCLVVALGLDAHEADPFRGMAITTAGFGRIGRLLGHLGLPTVLVQEGGYLNESLADNLKSFLDGFRANR
jgi:acetoin utilization deacetylase AcuC-like enzyme